MTKCFAQCSPPLVLGQELVLVDLPAASLDGVLRAVLPLVWAHNLRRAHDRESGLHASERKRGVLPPGHSTCMVLCQLDLEHQSLHK
jgi:hypothetical protein